ncbi:F-box protein [Trifolium medium]|uniref:F-box protein n=1 Tax=Trifolium medium TaxID=97028 RepID=A0A392MTL0_9FABA|nr:F-box protein [Trifolium medium]
MIRPDLSIHLLADPYCEVYKFKSLVESDGELLLVDRYKSGGLRIDVFRLDEKEKKWVKLTNLGDKVLFLGHGCCFSASASDLGVANGNCVIFNDDSTDCELGVYHLDQGQVSPLSEYPDYFKLFWPPPEWILELHS